MKYKLLILSVLFGSLSAYAELKLDMKDDKYGFKDQSGQVVIKHRYNYAEPFVNGVARVQKGNKWGMIDEGGKEVLPIKYDEMDDFNSLGYARVSKDDKYGYVRNDGTVTIEPVWPLMGTMNDDGFVWVGKTGKEEWHTLRGVYCFDRLVVPVKYQYLGVFQSTDSVDYSNGRPFHWKYACEVNKNGSQLSSSVIPYFWTRSAGEVSIVDMNGVETKFDKYINIGAPCEGYVVTCSEGKEEDSYNYCRLADGQRLFSKDKVTSFKSTPACLPFRNGKALVRESDTLAYFINTEGQSTDIKYDGLVCLPGDLIAAAQGDKWGIINDGGKILQTAKFSNMKLMTKEDDPFTPVCDAKSNLWGCVDITGKLVIPCRYKGMWRVRDGLVYVQTEKGHGLMDLTERFIVQPTWKGSAFPSKELEIIWMVDLSDRWHAVSLKTGKTLHGGYEAMGIKDDHATRWIKKDGKYGYANEHGEVVVPPLYDKLGDATEIYDYARRVGKSTMTSDDILRYLHHMLINETTFSLHETIESANWDF